MESKGPLRESEPASGQTAHLVKVELMFSSSRPFLRASFGLTGAVGQPDVLVLGNSTQNVQAWISHWEWSGQPYCSRLRSAPLNVFSDYPTRRRGL